MIKEAKRFFLLPALLSLLAGACSHPLHSESGLYHVALESTPKLAVKGIWLNGKGKTQLPQKSGIIYVHPLDVKAIQKESPIAAKKMREHMHGYITRELGAVLAEINQTNKTNWKLCTTPVPQADVNINLAVVHYSPQRPFLRVLIDFCSFWSPVPFTGTMMSPLSAGDICIEGTVRNARTGELILAFKDGNRKKPRYTQSEAYNQDGNADANLKFWAHKLACLIREYGLHSSEGTLRQRLDNMDVMDAAALRAGDTLEDVSDTVTDEELIIDKAMHE